MIVTRFLRHVPMIQERIAKANLDAIVLGLGPTAWLWPYLDRAAIGADRLRLFGVNDVWRITPVHDLIVMDHPVQELNPDSERHHTILTSTPERLWIHDLDGAMSVYGAAKAWHALLPDTLRSRMRPVCWKAFDPGHLNASEIDLGAPKPQTIAISPAAALTLAWREGMRRIGVLGVDCMPAHHSSWSHSADLDGFFTKLHRQAAKAGGMILNLSPVTSLSHFAKESQCQFLSQTSGSAPTSSSNDPAPKPCSSTASASTPPVQSTSTGCAPATAPTG